MKLQSFISCICLQIVLIFAVQLSAQVPQLINYQARLTNPSTGMPVADGEYAITFSLYDVPEGGTALWTETQSVQTSNGIYSVLLGSMNLVDVSLFTGAVRYLGVKIGTDPEMMPRKAIASIPYALHAKTADTVTGEIHENQSLAEVAAINNNANAQIKNVIDPTDAQDAVTKAFVTIRVSITGDTLFLGKEQWAIIPGISLANSAPHITDADGDGYTANQGDCNDNDTNIHPGAYDIPDDTIDQNCDGIIYAPNSNWQPGEPWIDSRPNHTYMYNTVQIGDQVWFAENICAETYPDGSQITGDIWVEAPCNPGYKENYYYNWEQACNKTFSNTVTYEKVQGICPTGWHVPSVIDWNLLRGYLGSSKGSKLRSAEINSCWLTKQYNTNESGFSAIGVGYYDYVTGQAFLKLGRYEFYWSATERSTGESAGDFRLYDDSMADPGDAQVISSNINYGYSVRCIKDQ